jgi:hypothetical protein
MVLEDLDRNQWSRRRKTRNGKSKRLLAAVLVVGVGAVAAAAVALKSHHGHGANPSASTVHPSATASAAVKSAQPPKTWRLIFDPSFGRAALDTGVWGTCYPWAPNGCTNYGNTADPEREWYVPAQVTVGGGDLRLTAERVPTAGLAQNGTAKEYGCRSGMVTTYPGLRFTYGYVQVVVKVPFGKGLWPALWLAAANETWPPEVDLLEHWGTDPSGKVYFHPLNGPRQGGPVSMPKLGDGGWHTFSLEWTKKRLSWYYDGRQVLTTTHHVPQQEMYLIANIADDVVGPGTCTGTMFIKSVKVWQPPL